jgi:transcription elongation factor Elf1
MLEHRVKQLRNQVDCYSRHNEALNRRLDTFHRKEATEKEAAEKEAAEEDNDEEED